MADVRMETIITPMPRSAHQTHGLQPAIVLPPGERFTAQAAGAIALIVRRHALIGGATGVVLGAACEAPFADVAFQPVRPIWWGWSNRSRYASGVVAALRTILPASVEVHNRPDLALRIARADPGRPVTLFLHNDPRGMRGARNPAQRARLLSRLTRMVAVSAWVRDALLDGVADPAQIPLVLHNMLDFRELPPRATREKLILFVGRLVADKGADLFVRACGAVLPGLSGWRAEMIGADRFGPDSPDTPFLRALRLAASEAGIALRGYQSHEAVLARMTRAAIAVVPSRWPEPFGMTALEAMGCGAAVICADRGGLPEVCGAAARMVAPEPAALAAAIAELAENDALRIALADAGRRQAARFDVAQLAPQLTLLRAEVLACAPP